MNIFPKTILVIHAHPDDTETYCSGTLSLLKKRGFNIVIATMTAGGLGGINSTQCKTIIARKQEAAAAAEELDAEFFCFDREDGFLFDDAKIRLEVLDLIRAVNPGIILTHLPNDYHIDHRTTSNIVEIATFLSTLPNMQTKEPPLDVRPLLYHTMPLSFIDPITKEQKSPDFFVNITETIDDKVKMLEHHESQITLMKVMHRMENYFEEMKIYNAELGKIAGCQYAEAFWQHLGAGFQKDTLLQNELEDYLIKK
ncbi:MAG: PIG-L family deacetylase [Spirochaetales bacterium]|nr:PIG-L family deacetylase [Spirochaetales bacterium]